MNRRTLFFLPGVGADPDFWRPVGDRLPADWTKVYFGWPGLGDQPHDPAVQSFEDLVGLVETRLSCTPSHEPVDLLAQSMGGAIAMHLALRHPARIRRLVLAVTAGGMDVQALGATDWRPGYAAEYPQAGAWIYGARPDYEPELPAIAHPALLLWGNADPISPVTVGHHLYNRLPNAELKVIDGGDHGLVHNRAAEVAPLIAAHLA